MYEQNLSVIIFLLISYLKKNLYIMIIFLMNMKNYTHDISSD